MVNKKILCFFPVAGIVDPLAGMGIGEIVTKLEFISSLKKGINEA